MKISWVVGWVGLGFLIACSGVGAAPLGDVPPAEIPGEVPEIEVPVAGVDTAADEGPVVPDAPDAVDDTDDDAVAEAPDAGLSPGGRPDPDRADRSPAPKGDEAPAAPPAPGIAEDPAEPVPEEDDDKGPKKEPAAKPAGITQVSDKSWKVTQSLVDTWHADPYQLSNVRESGAGWELIGVRQRNAYHLGMRGSDILLEVNGHKLDTKAQLLATYLSCKNDREFDVVFLRAGKRRTHHYSIGN